LYAVNSTLNAINAFSIDATSGALTPVAGSPFATAIGPADAQFDTTGHFLYVTHDPQQSNTLFGFAIDAITGALTTVPGAPYVVGTAERGLAIDPTGKNLYVPTGPAASMAGFSINESTGGLTAVPAVMNAPLDFHNQASVDRSGFFLYANDTANMVYRYTIDPQSGGLNALDSVTIGGNGGGRPVLVGSQ
jgi:6-phosphogluconolactonase